jgi:hypothetical protein
MYQLVPRLYMCSFDLVVSSRPEVNRFFSGKAHMVSVSAVQLCHRSKAAMGMMGRNGSTCFPSKLHLQNQWGWVCPSLFPTFLLMLLS